MSLWTRGSLSVLPKELIEVREEISYWRAIESSMVSCTTCPEVFSEVVDYLGRCVAKTERLVSMTPEIVEALEFFTEYIPSWIRLCKELSSIGYTRYSDCSKMEEYTPKVVEILAEILNDIEKYYKTILRYVRVLRSYIGHLKNMEYTESMYTGICLELESILVELKKLHQDLDEQIQDVQRKLNGYYVFRRAALKLVTLVRAAREEILKELEAKKSKRRKPTWQRVLEAIVEGVEAFFHKEQQG